MNRALLVGINKYPTSPLNGCVNDINDMANFLVSQCSFKSDEIRLLADERATKIEIIERLGWLLTGIEPGDRILFHFSGHGVQLPTRNPQGEVDGLDEVICPVDFDWTEEKAIRDKELGRIFKSIPTGVLFTFVSDSCHSEDVQKLIMKRDQHRKTIDPPIDIAWRIKSALDKNIKPIGIVKTMIESNVVLISGCKSNETSADAKIDDRFNGALTYYFLKYLNTNLSNPLTIVIEEVNKLLDQNQYDQNPQLNGLPELKQRPFLK